MIDFESQYEHNLVGMTQLHEVKLRQLAIYAFEAQAFDVLYRVLLGNRAYLDATFQQTGTLDRYDDALRLALSTLHDPMTEEQLVIWHMLQAARRVVMHQADQFTDDQLKELTLTGRYQEAISHAQLRASPQQKVAGLNLILQLLLSQGHHVSTVVARATELAALITSVPDRANAYFELGRTIVEYDKQLATDLFAQAIDVAKEHNQPAEIATLLRNFVLSGFISLDVVYMDIQGACLQAGARALLEFATYLQTQNDKRAIQVVRLAVETARTQTRHQPTTLDTSRVWGEIVKHCYDLDLPETPLILTEAQNIWQKYDGELLRLATYLLQKNKTHEAYAIAQHIADPHHNREIVSYLAQAGHYPEALTVARQVEDPWSRNLSLHRVVVFMWHTGDDALKNILPEMLNNVRQASLDPRSLTIESELAVVRTMIELFLRQEAFPIAITLVELFGDESERNTILACQIAPAMTLVGQEMQAEVIAQANSMEEAMRREFDTQRKELTTRISQELPNLPLFLKPYKSRFVRLTEILDSWEMEDAPALAALTTDSDAFISAIIQNNLDEFLTRIKEENRLAPSTQTPQRWFPVLNFFLSHHLGLLDLAKPPLDQQMTIEMAFATVLKRCHFAAAVARLEALEKTQLEGWVELALTELLQVRGLLNSDGPLLYDLIKVLIQFEYKPVQALINDWLNSLTSSLGTSVFALGFQAMENLAYVMQREGDTRASKIYNYLHQKLKQLPMSQRIDACIDLCTNMFRSGNTDVSTVLDEAESLVAQLSDPGQQANNLERIALIAADPLPSYSLRLIAQVAQIRKEVAERSAPLSLVGDRDYGIFIKLGLLLTHVEVSKALNAFTAAHTRIRRLNPQDCVEGLLKLAEARHQTNHTSDTLIVEAREVSKQLPPDGTWLKHRRDCLLLKIATHAHQLESPLCHELIVDAWKVIQEILVQPTSSVDSSSDILHHFITGRLLIKLMFKANHPQSFEGLKWLFQLCRTDEDLMVVYYDLCSSGYRLQKSDLDLLKKYYDANHVLAGSFVDLLFLSESYDSIIQIVRELTRDKEKSGVLPSNELTNRLFALKNIPIRLAHAGQKDLARQAYQTLYPYLFPAQEQNAKELLIETAQGLTIGSLRASRQKSKALFILNVFGLVFGFWMVPFNILITWSILLRMSRKHEPLRHIKNCAMRGQYLTDMGETAEADNHYVALMTRIEELMHQKKRSPEEKGRNEDAIRVAMQSLTHSQRWTEAEKVIRLTGFAEPKLINLIHQQQILARFQHLPESEKLKQWANLPPDLQESTLNTLQPLLLQNGYYAHRLHPLNKLGLSEFMHRVVQESASSTQENASLGHRIMKSTCRVIRWNQPYWNELYAYM